MSNSPIFVGGTGRSGTTIMKRVLGAHPDVGAIDSELRIVVDPGGALDLYRELTQSWSPHRAHHAVCQFEKLIRRARPSGRGMRIETKITRRLGLQPRPYASLDLYSAFGEENVCRALKQLKDYLVEAESATPWIGATDWLRRPKFYETRQRSVNEVAFAIHSFFSQLFSEIKEEATYWVDDTPLCILQGLVLIEVFPGAKFVHMYRNSQDVLDSYLKQSWGAGERRVIARRIEKILERWETIKSHLPEGAYTEVELESLVDDPRSTLERVTREIGMEVSASWIQAAVEMIDPSRVGDKRELS